MIKVSPSDSITKSKQADRHICFEMIYLTLTQASNVNWLLKVFNDYNNFD